MAASSQILSVLQTFTGSFVVSFARWRLSQSSETPSTESQLFSPKQAKEDEMKLQQYTPFVALLPGCHDTIPAISLSY